MAVKGLSKVKGTQKFMGFSFLAVAVDYCRVQKEKLPMTRLLGGIAL